MLEPAAQLLQLLSEPPSSPGTNPPPARPPSPSDRPGGRRPWGDHSRIRLWRLPPCTTSGLPCHASCPLARWCPLVFRELTSLLRKGLGQEVARRGILQHALHQAGLVLRARQLRLLDLE